MESVSAIKMFIGMFLICVIPSLQATGSDKEIQELKTMLRQSLQQNKRLERQVGRVSKVWTGLQKMCATLGVVASTGTEESHTTETIKDIRITGISSSGLKDNSVDVTITYVAPVNVIVMRRVFYAHSQVCHPESVLKSEGHQYKDTIHITDFANAGLLLYRIRRKNSAEYIDISIKASSLNDSVDEQLKITQDIKGKLNDSYEVINGEDLLINVPLSINGEPMIREGPGDSRVENILMAMHVELTYMNTSAFPPKFSVVPSRDDYTRNIGMSIFGSPNQTFLGLNISSAFVQYGGVLSLYLPVFVDSRVIQHYLQVTESFVFMPGNDRFFPENGIAIYAQEKTYVNPEHGSIVCASLGIPAPQITMLKVRKSGKAPKKQKVISYNTNTGTSIVRSFTNKSPSEVKGIYICRASNSNHTVETRTEVDVFVAAKFIDAKTGLKRMTLQDIVIACSATGNPRPDLSIVSPIFQNLASVDGNKVEQTTSDTYTSHLELTLPRAVVDYDIVKCTAVQSQYSSYETDIFLNGEMIKT